MMTGEEEVLLAQLLIYFSFCFRSSFFFPPSCLQRHSPRDARFVVLVLTRPILAVLVGEKGSNPQKGESVERENFHSRATAAKVKGKITWFNSTYCGGSLLNFVFKA